MEPLVSIIMPCYNSSETLSISLISILTQTYKNWECILVDDGSTDSPYEIVSQINDPRIRYIRLDQNMGRGTARQIALDNAKGEYLCMLDADDWIYPYKFEQQLQIFNNNPNLAIVSSGLAIVNNSNNIVGVRGNIANDIKTYKPLNGLRCPPIPHAPSMIKMNIAKQTKYDNNLRNAEDIDFLLRIVIDNSFCILPDITYAYKEDTNRIAKKILRVYRHKIKVLLKHRKRFMKECYIEILKIILKYLIFKFINIIGLEEKIIKKRSKKPSIKDINEFLSNRRIIYKNLKELKNG